MRAVQWQGAGTCAIYLPAQASRILLVDLPGLLRHREERNEVNKTKAELIAEAKFFREQLELIASDTRKTRAQRMAASALSF